MPKIRLKQLAPLCRRVGTGLDAGIDIRRIWETEADNHMGLLRDKLRAVSDSIGQGNSLYDALSEAGDYFPRLMLELVELGERTGRLEQSFFRLADHYEYTLGLRRTFWNGVAWPLTELGIAILVVGLVIWILGAIGGRYGRQPMTLFGLSGTSGLIIYLLVVGTVLGLIALAITSIVKGWFNTEPIFQFFMRVPGLSGMLQVMAMARLTWSLGMAVESGLDPERTLDISVRSTRNTYYTAKLPEMQSVISAGDEMHEAFRSVNRYPVEFLDALASGELAGRTGEAMEVLSRDYDEQTKLYMRGLTVAASIFVFVVVAGIIIAMIFQMVRLYLNPIYQELGM